MASQTGFFNFDYFSSLTRDQGVSAIPYPIPTNGRGT